MSAYERREWVGAAVATTLTAGISNADTSIGITASTGWPTGGTGPWTVVIDRGTASEEQVDILSRSSLTLTVNSSGRGFNGTTAASHSTGATIEVCAGKRDFDEANNAVHQTIGGVTTKGDLLGTSAANTLTRLAVGTNSYSLRVDSTQTTGLRYGLADPGGATYTPTLTQSGAVTKTVTYANYVADGKLVYWNIELTLTGSGTTANAVTVGLPVTNRASQQSVGNGIYYDVSTTTVYNVLAVATSGASGCILLSSQAGGVGGWGVAPALAAASGDIIYLQGHYWSA